MDPAIFRCLSCGTVGLERQPDAFLCPTCHTPWPIRSGVPLFLKGLEIGSCDLSLTPEQWSYVCTASHLADTPTMHERVKEIFRRTYQLPELHLSAENNYYFQRLPELVNVVPEQKPDLSKLPVNENIRYSIERHFVPEVLPAGAMLTSNVRFVNAGQSLISSKGKRAVRVGYRWRNVFGEPVPCKQLFTSLPIDLAPGRAITLPTLLSVPVTPAIYSLEVGFFDADGLWLDTSALRLAVTVVVGLTFQSPDHWMHLDKPLATYNYEEDHKLCVEMLTHELSDVPAPRVLEVGGCCQPMVKHLPGELYITDIDAQTLQIGELMWRETHPHMHFLATDAGRLPFADGVFDSVALFATMHHLCDPVGCLTEFRRVLKPTGFILLGSDPVGNYFAETVDAKLLKELESGINEQVFGEHEYVRMFLQAGLFATKVEIDRGAFRAILRPNPGQQTYPQEVRKAENFHAPLGYKELLRLNMQWAKRQWNKRVGALLPSGKGK